MPTFSSTYNSQLDDIIMAFVFGKNKKNSVFQVSSQAPGPGDYNPSPNKLIEHSAPFNSSSFKQTEFDKEPSKIGPGCYEPDKTKQTIGEKKMRMTSSFQSKVERFKTEQPDRSNDMTFQMKINSDYEEGRRYKPRQNESYDEAMVRTKSKIGMLQDANNKRKVNSIGVNKQFVRIILSNPQNTEITHSVMIDSSIKKKQNGPGSYQVSKRIDFKQGHVVDWSRNTVSRFKTEKSKNPGPGAYELQNQPKRSVSSMSAPFAFQGLRSHMDEIIYKTKMPFKVKVIEQKQLKDRYPGPGQYEPKITSSKSFHYGEQAFGTTNSDFSQMKRQSVPGPGYYQVNANNLLHQSIKEEIRKTREKIFKKDRIKIEKTVTLEQNHKEQIRKQCIREMQTDGKFYSLQERCSSKIGNFCQSQRFKSTEKITRYTIPGPGQYKVDNLPQQRYPKGVQHPFNSTSDRLDQNQLRQKIPFYDLDRNDMGKKALRMKKNIQNLKQIDIQKAPFNSKQKRFETHQSEIHVVSEARMTSAKIEINRSHKPQRVKMGSFLSPPKRNGQNQSSVFRSKSRRSWMNSNNPLGPGDYHNNTTFQKKSFNQEYNYKAPPKIRNTYRTRSSLA